MDTGPELALNVNVSNESLTTTEEFDPVAYLERQQTYSNEEQEEDVPELVPPEE